MSSFTAADSLQHSLTPANFFFFSRAYAACSWHFAHFPLSSAIFTTMYVSYLDGPDMKPEDAWQNWAIKCLLEIWKLFSHFRHCGKKFSPLLFFITFPCLQPCKKIPWIPCVSHMLKADGTHIKWYNLEISQSAQCCFLLCVLFGTDVIFKQVPGQQHLAGRALLRAFVEQYGHFYWLAIILHSRCKILATNLPLYYAHHMY